MSAFDYTSGNPNNLTAGANASMADIQGPFVDLRDFLNNGGLDTSNLATSAGIKETQLASAANGLAKGAFSAYRNAALSLTTGLTVTFDTEEFDVSGWYDTSNGRFTPQVPGYYRFSWSVTSNASITADQFWQANLHKNGTLHKDGGICFQRGTVAVASVGTHLAVANGSTDFFTVVITHNTGAGVANSPGVAGTYFGGELIGRV